MPLGSRGQEFVCSIVLPFTRIGVVGAIMLGLCRALGERIAVTFVIATRIASALRYWILNHRFRHQWRTNSLSRRDLSLPR